MVEVKSDTHKKETGASDPIVTRLAKEDKVPWYSKPNLRFLYLMLFPTCMGIELTSGFDSQLINALQIVPSWIDCRLIPLSPARCYAGLCVCVCVEFDWLTRNIVNSLR